jgi:hypothetical protein
MYCPTCGVAVVSGLRFCNHCGARLAGSGSEAEPKQIPPAFLIAAMTVVFIFGLFAISLLTVILNDGLHLNSGQSMGFAVFGLFMLAVLEGVFITLLFRRPRRKKEPNQTNQLHLPNIEQPRALPDMGEDIPSVTEHTTRAFDYIPKEQRKR